MSGALYAGGRSNGLSSEPGAALVLALLVLNTADPCEVFVAQISKISVHRRGAPGCRTELARDGILRARGVIWGGLTGEW